MVRLAIWYCVSKHYLINFSTNLSIAVAAESLKSNTRSSHLAASSTSPGKYLDLQKIFCDQNARKILQQQIINVNFSIKVF